MAAACMDLTDLPPPPPYTADVNKASLHAVDNTSMKAFENNTLSFIYLFPKLLQKLWFYI